MKNNQRGFTLIEVLIVVLIVAILSAIAVPQYQKAVLKSRFSSLVPLGKALNEGNEAYYLEHGSYTDNVGNLDVTTQNNQAEITLGNEPQHQYVKLTRSDIHNNLVMYQKHSVNFPGEIHCEAVQDNTLANWLCAESLKGSYIGDKYGFSIYSLNENFSGSLDRLYINTDHLTLMDNDICESSVGWSCRFTHAQNAICKGNAGDGCINSIFEQEAVCEGQKGSACSRNTYKTNSSCVGKAEYVCDWSSFDQSFCKGQTAWACGASNFSNHSVCYANAKNACPGNKYDETSCCQGAYCPEEEDTCSYKGIVVPLL